jgi:2-oxoglutarate dehydrogenase E1 component
MDKFSFLNAAHTAFFETMYEQYLENPDSVEPSWKAFFQGFDFGVESVLEDWDLEDAANGQAHHLQNGTVHMLPESVQKEFQVVKLIDGYRTRGHLFTQTNPVRERRKYAPTLAIENFGLQESDLDLEFSAGEIIGIGKATLRKIIEHLERIYCESIGVEYMYMRNPERIAWIQEQLNQNDNRTVFSSEEKIYLLKKLNEAVAFESFLHTKYVGQKRFSLEGNESLIPALDAIIERAATKGVKQFVLGMAHRGRLNVLTNIFGKSPKDIFSEFDGKDYEEAIFDGDVKYHLGWTSKRETLSGHVVNMNIAPNPSHLETVNGIVEGITRAKQDNDHSENPQEVLPILIHGDAAFAGQGVVYEVIQMAKLDGYRTQGTVHIVVNNQIGFTTNYLDARSSTYCTDVAKVTLSPVLHVNADDVEAVVHAAQLALEYRMRFSLDIFIDLLGYRKYGHNEGDEPKFTQPLLYSAIAKHKNPRDLYADKLIASGVISADFVTKIEEEYKNNLESDLIDSRKVEKTVITPFMQDEWEAFKGLADAAAMLKAVDTSYPLDKLNTLAERITTLPEGIKLIRKTERLIDTRRQMYFENNQLDWAMGELLAYASLLEEGNDVRITGQDVERGTFSHRHAVLKTEKHEEEVVLLNKLGDLQHGDFYAYNSLLSEYAVMAFDYGYAMASPSTLTIWEAQFGDFSNGAQIVIDQYLSAAEDKWKMQNGLVLFLPHGYEGQGAEHSSGRMERYLQLCAKDNMFIADVTTPANLFHIVRRQQKATFRKPLVVFTPKSLLRHPKVVSTKEELANGTFQPLIDDSEVKLSEVKTLVLCTGKFYYDLLARREEENRTDVALVRLEQLFPLPVEELDALLEKYDKVDEVVWAQEEPRNMGAYSHLLLHYDKARAFRVASRRFYGAPAAGSAVRAARRHQQVIDYVFDKTRDNFKL